MGKLSFNNFSHLAKKSNSLLEISGRNQLMEEKEKNIIPDINRNIFNPAFKKCLWVPIHQGLSIQKMTKICETISSAS